MYFATLTESTMSRLKDMPLKRSANDLREEEAV